MAERRNGRHGAGGVYERPDGRIVARIAFDGKRRACYVKSKKEGYSWLAKMQRDHELGVPAITQRQTVERFLASWLETIKPTVRASTCKRYEELVRLHIVPTLGKTSLERLSPQQVDQLYARKLAEGLSPTTVHYISVTLHCALKAAMRLGLVQRNVEELATSPKKARYEAVTLTAEQLLAFLQVASGDRLEALYWLVMSTSMREGEILALRWRDVDLEGKSVQVRRTVQRLHGQFVFNEPKSHKSRRQVQLTAKAVAALKEHHGRQLEERLALGDGWQDLDLVFPLQDGSPMDGIHLLRYQFHPLLLQAGLPKIRFHDLRHTVATLLMGQGIHPGVVASMLGHSTVMLTLDTYSHAAPTMQQAATEAMDRLLGSSLRNPEK